MRFLRHLPAVLAVLSAAVASAIGVLAATAPPAAACSCVIQSLPEHLADSDAVFRGAPVEREGDAYVDPKVSYVFDVEAVYLGDVPERTTVTTGSQGSACGLPDLRLDRSYLVFASEARDGEYSISLCGGTREASGAYVDRLAQHVGDPRPPGGAVDAPDDDPDVSAGAPSDADGGGMGDRALPMALVAGGAAALIVGALLVGAWRAAHGNGRGATVR